MHCKSNYWFLDETQHTAGIRSTRLQMFFKIGAFKNFAIFRRKQLCWGLFLIKLQKKTLWHRCLPVNIVKLLITAFLWKTLFLWNGLSWMNILGENVLTSNRHSRSANLNPNMGSAESKKNKDTWKWQKKQWSFLGIKNNLLTIM